MNIRRDRFEIVYDILRSIQEKKTKMKPTHLLYKSNLSYKRMQSYVNELIEQDLICEVVEKKNKFYKLTDKGYKFLEEYSKIKSFKDSFGI